MLRVFKQKLQRTASKLQIPTEFEEFLQNCRSHTSVPCLGDWPFLYLSWHKMLSVPLCNTQLGNLRHSTASLL